MSIALFLILKVEIILFCKKYFCAIVFMKSGDEMDSIYINALLLYPSAVLILI